MSPSRYMVTDDWTLAWTLLSPNLPPQESGEYTAVVSSSAGTARHQWQLKVEVAEVETKVLTNTAMETTSDTEDIVPDETVVSGDISDPEFYKLLVSEDRKPIMELISKSFRE